MLGKKFNKATYVTSSTISSHNYKGLKVLRTFTKLVDLWFLALKLLEIITNGLTPHTGSRRLPFTDICIIVGTCKSVKCYCPSNTTWKLWSFVK